jgi:hypothetical protein
MSIPPSGNACEAYSAADGMATSRPRRAPRHEIGLAEGRRDALVAVLGGMILTRSGGQSDYAAIVVTCAFNSNSIGLT